MLHAQIVEVPISLAGDWLSRSPVVKLQLTCRSYFYGPEVVGSPVTSTLPAFTVTVADVKGDVPAEGRLIVTDNASQARRHVEWGLESRYLNPALGLILDSDSFVTSGYTGTQTTLAGAYDPGGAGNSIVLATLALQPSAVCSTGSLAHVGRFKVKARVWAQTTGVRVRLSARAGDSSYSPTPAGYVSPPVAGEFAEVDLGVINIPPATLGAQTWDGRIEAYSTLVGDSFYIDYLVLIAVAEGYGKARGVYSNQPGALTGRDEFTSTIAGAVLNARVAPAGGTWATSGATTDFTFADGPGAGQETVQRATSADASPRFAVLGAAITDTEVGATIRTDAKVSDQGVVARWVDASNYLTLMFTGGGNVELRAVVAGATVATSTAHLAEGTQAFQSYQFRLIALATGRAIGTVVDPNGATWATLEISHASIATGGALASGKPGLLDRCAFAGGGTRYYDNVYVAVPAPEEVAIAASQSIEFRRDGCFRENAAGTTYGRPWYRGDRFLLPQAGYMDRDTRILVKARRNDVDSTGDANIADSTTVQVAYTPRYRMPRGPM